MDGEAINRTIERLLEIQLKICDAKIEHLTRSGLSRHPELALLKVEKAELEMQIKMLVSIRQIRFMENNVDKKKTK